MARKARGRNEGSIHERDDGRWVGQVSLGTDGHCKRIRRTVSGATKAEVAEKIRRLQHDADRGRLVNPSGMTVAKYLDDVWLPDISRTVSPKTHDYYADQVRLHLSPIIGALRLEKLAVVHVRQLYAEMEKRGSSPAMQKKVGTTLGVALAHAVEIGLLSHNVARDVKKPRTPRHEKRVFSPVEVRRFLAAVAGDRLEALFVLAVATGMRQGEILGLLWRDVDLDAGVIDVRRSLSERGAILELKEPKTAAGRRRVPVGPSVVAALAGHRERMKAEGFHGPDRLVFCDTIGGFIRKMNLLHRHFNPACVRAGLKCRFHDLRHAHASNLLDAGVPLPVVSARIGHGSPSTTAAIYAHAIDAGQGKAVDAAEGIISGGSVPIGSASAAPDETIV